MGGIGKYFKEICLLQQPFVKDDKVSVEEHIAAVAKQVGASIKLVNYTRFEKGEGIEKRFSGVEWLYGRVEPHFFR